MRQSPHHSACQEWHAGQAALQVEHLDLKIPYQAHLQHVVQTQGIYTPNNSAKHCTDSRYINTYNTATHRTG